jgi:hypothetical protein
MHCTSHAIFAKSRIRSGVKKLACHDSASAKVKHFHNASLHCTQSTHNDSSHIAMEHTNDSNDAAIMRIQWEAEFAQNLEKLSAHATHAIEHAF